jgi:tetratricopeptide (TPR) repeat protein
MSLHKYIWVTVIIALITACTFAPEESRAQSPELTAVIEKFRKLEKLRKYVEAIPFAEKVVELAKREFGTEHGYYSAGLSRLAVLYQDQGRHAEAEPLFKRALAIQNNIPTRLIQRLFICKIVFVYKIVPAVKGGVV